MSDNIKLTFDADLPEDDYEDSAATIARHLSGDEASPAPTAEAGELADEEDALSPEELAQVDEFAKQIDVHSTNAILQYGSGAQKKMADFSETALSSVRTQDLGEIGDLLAGVVTDLRSFDVEDEKGLRGLFKRGANKMESMRAKYDKAEGNIEKTVKVLQAHQMKLMKDAAMLDKLYGLNLEYFRELSMYILAGKKALKAVREGELAGLRAKAQASGRTEDAQAVQDLEAKCERLEKKISDLQLTRTIAMQTAPQIRLVQGNDTMMVEKIQSTLVNTIPLWKSQMVLALGVEHSSQAAAAQREVTDMTNELLKKNAEKLKLATVETAKESERGIVDIETLQQTNASLISTFDEVMQIQEEGRKKRLEAENEMLRMEGELREKLLEIRK